MKLASVAVVACVVAAAPSPGRAQQMQTTKPAAATSSVALPPTVAFEVLSSGGRRMTVSVSAPRTDATLGRPADVREVELNSDTWYCEEHQGEVSTGVFVRRVRELLELHLAGAIVDPTVFSRPRDLANQPDLDAFARGVNWRDNAIKVKRTVRYPEGSDAGEIRFNDCYTAQEMQAIKAEVARILGPSN